MSLSVGISSAAGVTIGGKSAATIRALSDETADAANQALGIKDSDAKQVRTGAVGLDKVDASTEKDGPDNASVAEKVLLERLKELQEQLREQQKQLAAAQAASYPTPEAKTTAVMAIQGQIANTNAAIMETANSLYKEIAKGSASGAVVNTTA
ncbi:hypothetical protein [Pseudomonas sp. ANT_H12B]|uniref:hypothetical protein n=1 Tax=Pseudomonas sp. ANT_H12B TaxID=2597348 RepID=UPI0011EFD904|nr:hypothetical protein [Pseudomonas sp. ANT_H12B]KAA0975532.1 hypothetical protein FQ185_08510 [Pseudomonas sp. ANT_H12B]